MRTAGGRMHDPSLAHVAQRGAKRFDGLAAGVRNDFRDTPNACAANAGVSLAEAPGHGGAGAEKAVDLARRIVHSRVAQAAARGLHELESSNAKRGTIHSQFTLTLAGEAVRESSGGRRGSPSFFGSRPAFSKTAAQQSVVFWFCLWLRRRQEPCDTSRSGRRRKQRR